MINRTLLPDGLQKLTFIKKHACAGSISILMMEVRTSVLYSYRKQTCHAYSSALKFRGLNFSSKLVYMLHQMTPHNLCYLYKLSFLTVIISDWHIQRISRKWLEKEKNLLWLWRYIKPYPISIPRFRLNFGWFSLNKNQSVLRKLRNEHQTSRTKKMVDEIHLKDEKRKKKT